MQLLNQFSFDRWLPSYSRPEMRGDVVAGLTVGVMLIPQGMAYAVLLGVPPIYGLYASVVPLLIYPLFGTSRQLAVGVIAIDMFVAGAGLALVVPPGSEQYVPLAILLALMVGILQLLMGLFRLGFIVNLLSRPVIAGFTSAAAIVISFSQLGNLLGLDLPRTQYIFVLLWDFLHNAGAVHPISALIGVGGIVFLFLLRAWKPLFPAPLTLVVAGTLGVWILGLEQQGVAVIGTIPTGLPSFELPEISGRPLRALLPTVITLALVQFVSVVSLGKVFAARHRYRIDPNRELVAVGMSNIVGSLFRSVPVSGSFSRSAVNDQAGACTPMANVVAALVIATTLLFLTPLFQYLPIPVLAAIIILAAVGLVNVEEVRLLVHLKRIDGAIALFTFGATLIAGVLEGVLLGIAASVVAIMYRISRPKVASLGHLPGTQAFGDFQRHEEARALDDLLILRVEASLSFANAEFFRDVLQQRALLDEPSPKAVIIDAAGINDVDTTAVELLMDITDTLREQGMDLYFGGIKGAVADVLDRAGFVEKLGRDHFFVNAHEAVRQVLTEWGMSESYLEATRERVELPGRADRPPP